MNMIEQIKADREAGTDGPWAAFTDDTAPHTNIVSPVPHTSCVFSLAGREKRHPDIKRVCRVPDMEAALIAADELANEVEQLSDRLRQYEADGCDCEESNREYLGHVTPPLARTEYALAAYRAAIGAE